ncbi:MAG: MerR family transcriptional regulator [Oscillospiraceae bacterium]|nr:MerR family transcriptional regulator [Oscillospiraceae bacterium]
MVTTDEICSYAGITKRTLQVYREEGLVKPAKSSHAGNLYSGGTENFVSLIRLFSETGYKLKEIKPIIYSNDLNISGLLNMSKAFLEKRISRDKALYKLVSMLAGVYEELKRIIKNRNHISRYIDDNLNEPIITPKEFMEGTNGFVAAIEELDEIDDDYELFCDPEGMGRLIARIAAVALMMGENIESAEILNICHLIFDIKFPSELDSYIIIGLLGAFVDPIVTDFIAGKEVLAAEQEDNESIFELSKEDKTEIISEIKEYYYQYYSESLGHDRFKYTSIVLTNYYEKYYPTQVRESE